MAHLLIDKGASHRAGHGLRASGHQRVVISNRTMNENEGKHGLELTYMTYASDTLRKNDISILTDIPYISGDFKVRADAKYVAIVDNLLPACGSSLMMLVLPFFIVQMSWLRERRYQMSMRRSSVVHYHYDCWSSC
jgi:hypothetical protein